MRHFILNYVEYVLGLPHFGLSLFWVLFLFIRTLGVGIPKPPLALFIALVLVIIIKNSKSIDGIHKTLCVFIIYMLVSLVVISPPDIFQPYSRFLYFVMSLFVTSSLVQGKNMREFRNTSLILILNFSVLVTLISFVCFFLGINLVIRDYDDADSYMVNPNIFAGITSHSMVLGFVSMIAFIYTMYLALTNKHFYLWCITTICFITCLFSASRGALVASIIGFLYLMIICSNKKGYIIKRAFFISIAIVLSIPIWKTYTDRVLIKQETRVNSGIFDSRSEKVNARWNEFRESPIIGIGFSVIDTKYDRIKVNGAIEPGSSWLGILSMTGIIGFLLFFAIIYRSWLIVHNRRLSLYDGLIVVISIHMLVEGYVFSAGSLQCIVLWTILGTSFDFGKRESWNCNKINYRNNYKISQRIKV